MLVRCFFFVGVGGVAGNANLFFTAFDRPDRYQRHLVVIVNLREANQHFRGEFLQGIHEPKVSRFTGQLAYEFRFNLRVLGPNGPDGNVRAVEQLDCFGQV